MTTTKSRKGRRPFTSATYETYDAEIINRARAVLNTVGNAASQKKSRPYKFKPIKGKPGVAHIVDRFNKPVVRASGHTIELSLTAVKKKKAPARKARSKVRNKAKTLRTKRKYVRRVQPIAETDVVKTLIDQLAVAKKQDAVLRKIKDLLDAAL